MKNNFYQKSFVTVDNLTVSDISLIFNKTGEMKKLVETKGGDNRLRGKIMAALFYEPSSRTFSSFITSMQRLGGGTIPLNGMGVTSVAKGETLEDTARVFSSYADVMVIRHNQQGTAKLFSDFATVPVINAGDGTGEHPTQALLDAYTIKDNFPSFSELTVGLIGDLLNGRTVHSLSKILSMLGVKKFFFISPETLKMPSTICNMLINKGISITQIDDLINTIGELDVIYDTRVQKERFEDLEEYERLKLAYIINPQVMKKAKKNSILMHPLPRVGEISTEVDSDPRAKYFSQQMQNGMFTRMALLDLILNK